MAEPTYVVFNPQSGKGRGARLIQPALAALAAVCGEVAHGVTERAGDEARLTEEALARGCRRLIAVGGDGTVSNVANVLIAAGASDVVLGHIPTGTGCDFARSLGMPLRDLAACAAIVCGPHRRRIDVGCIEGRFFLNLTGFGLDVAVLQHSWTVRGIPRPLIYIYSACRQIISFRGFPVTIEADGVDLGRGEFLMIIIANAREFGGGLKIAPRADLGDGLVDAMIFRDMSTLRRLSLFAKVQGGRHEGAPGVVSVRASHLRLRFGVPPAYELDGEWHQARTADLVIETRPRVLEMAVPASHTKDVRMRPEGS